MDSPLDRVLELAQGMGRHAPHVQGQHVCMLHVNSRNAFLHGLLWSPCETIRAPQHTRITLHQGWQKKCLPNATWILSFVFFSECDNVGA